jgi:F-type H+-transporting ATPase subunit gamma
MAIGKQAEKFLRSNKLQLKKSHNEVFDELNFDSSSVIASGIMTQFANKKYDRVELVYNRFKNAAVQIVTTEQFLPVEVQGEKEAVNTSFDFIYEPSKEYIVQELIPRSLKIQFYKALLDSNAAEHGARMTAMHMATDNATELIRELTLTFNKARQAAITNEILEVTNGAEALNS